MKRKPITLFLRENGADSAILLWWSARKNIEVRSWVEVRGNLNEWTPDSLFHQLHDIKRVNVSELHAGRPTQLLPEWEGWEIAAKVLEGS